MKNLFSMIKIASLFLFLLLVNSLQRASAQDTLADRIITANDLKSGNWQDVFSSFFQLAATDLTGQTKSLKFQSTLLAIRSKTNPTLLVDTNYIKEGFSRNFQFNFALGLDSNFNLKGFSGGFTWAAVNKRDSTLVSFVGTDVDLAFKKYTDDLIPKLNDFNKTIRDTNNVVKPEFKALADSISAALLQGKDYKTLPVSFLQYLKDTHYDSTAYSKVQKAYQHALADARLRPLLTLSLNSAFLKNARFDSATFNAIYLQGITRSGKPLELDARAGITARDSTIGTDKYRVALTSSAGLDYALISSFNKDANSYTPILEIKPYVEYDRIFTSTLTGEKKTSFYASLDLRLKVTNNLWLPFTLKYDFNSKSFLGFLNVSFNMDAFKSSSTKNTTKKAS